MITIKLWSSSVCLSATCSVSLVRRVWGLISFSSDIVFIFEIIYMTVATENNSSVEIKYNTELLILS